jgi:hypothetical protein
VPKELLDDQNLAEVAQVKSVDRDLAGCRLFTIVAVPSNVQFRACVPDAAFPFDAGAVITVTNALYTSSGSTMIQFEDDAGNELRLARVSFLERITSATFGGPPLALDEEVTCSRIDATCGDVEVPARITAMIGGAAHRVVFGEALPGSDAEHATYVLGASGHPVVNVGCTRPGNEEKPSLVDDASGSAWVATVTRIPLGP